MRCISPRSYESTDLLTDGTAAVQQLTGSRSLLPPSPTADELLQLLHESGHPCTSSTAPDSDMGVFGWPPTSFSAACIKCKCPTSRRVASSFAAAGAHSMLGEMLQFFAESVTRLFTTGVADPSVRAFPSEWDRRLHAPAAASLRQHHLYELQGFSTLFTYIWGQVAASLPLLREQHGEEKALRESTERGMASSTSVAMRPTRGSSAKSPAAQQPPSRLPLSASAATAHQPQPFHRTARKGGSGGLESGNASAHARPLLSLSPAALHLPNAEMAPTYCRGKRQKDGPIAAVSSRFAAQPPTLAVLQHALTAQARAQRPFLPSIPLEGLVPSSGARMVEGPHPENSGAANDYAKRLLASASSNSNATASYPASARTLSLEQAMQLDRQRELQKKLGVRRVRNYAAEDDMRNYLDNYQANMRSVLDGDDVTEDGT
ncbi:conserved hypothetical protein [Leishmania major strain Friedlin]|uniref:Uncharacterized protein n=1 Tax=Leishmania major TaxID=5664 RepID=Q4Q106_LEIMA|nr:conserved hypothetical protein [Leishmania major strain Friedlin]CAG9583955.1 hypothetical_protein_-_conserved [Leishmania major strain Friedlin]CAJ09375.1 conserved hypothetical protein [Leishmania major strain Friedlin]|eukprot:XP_001686992.1 conserved hypothetical protein [Leishmania major strain Friedlin]